MPERARIGFDRTISSEWMDAAVARVMIGEAPDATRAFLWDFLEGVESGTTNNSNRGKTLTVLTRIWVSVPNQAEPLKQAALKCVESSSGDERIGLHWPWLSAPVRSSLMWQRMSESSSICMAKQFGHRLSAA